MTMMRDAHVGEVASSRVSHNTASIDKWFVGSSRRSTSGWVKMAAARATRTRQPPLSARISRSRSTFENPKFSNRASARASAVVAPMSSSRSHTSVRR
mmetsp:Transcript_6068/g.20477  ORF Transcript_6068/g.20477 Transcript_6068/m.20477 type:complete len:98 (-) Transcript_6068:765-1058(-)